jgi:hypothetical protein
MPVLHRRMRGFENTNMLTNLQTVTLFHCRSRVERRGAWEEAAAWAAGSSLVRCLPLRRGGCSDSLSQR